MSESKIYSDDDGDYDQNDGGGCNDDDDHGNDGDDNVDDKAAEANLCGGGQIIIRRGPVSSSYLVEIMRTMIMMKLKMVTNLITEP